MKVLYRRILITFLLLGILSGLVRWAQSVYAIPGESVQFSSIHDLTYNQNTTTMTRTGNDPYVEFVLPAGAIPIRKVSFVFAGVYVEGEGKFYILQSPQSPKPGQEVPAVIGSVERNSDTFEVNGSLQDSTALRLDLPDFLMRPLSFRRVVISTPFIRWSSWSFRVMLLSLLATVAVFVIAKRQVPKRTEAGN